MQGSVTGAPTDGDRSDDGGSRVDDRVLELRPGCLDPYVMGSARDALLSGYGRPIEAMTLSLRAYLAEDSPLVSVAAHYAALTMRHSYATEGITNSYPLFLLSGWLWDDLADTNKGNARAARVLKEALPILEQAMTQGSVDAVPRTLGRFRRPISMAVRLTAQAHRGWRDQAPEYAMRIESEGVRFLRSFVQKIKLTHSWGGSQASYAAVRIACVGMQPCYELSYALKAQAACIGTSDHLAYLSSPSVQRCADAATLHCAAINDLFSLYKDRCVEDTANFPAVLGSGQDLERYFEGAVRTVEFVRHTYRRFLACCADLPLGPSRKVVVETWEHMMEGNLFYHLLVPRYREGIMLLRTLLDATLSPHERYARFAGAFGEQPRLPMSGVPSERTIKGGLIEA